MIQSVFEFMLNDNLTIPVDRFLGSTQESSNVVSLLQSMISQIEEYFKLRAVKSQVFHNRNSYHSTLFLDQLTVDCVTNYIIDYYIKINLFFLHSSFEIIFLMVFGGFKSNILQSRHLNVKIDLKNFIILFVQLEGFWIYFCRIWNIWSKRLNRIYVSSSWRGKQLWYW